MIGIAAPTYDPAGALLLDASINNPYQGERRGSITATLDGSSAVYDTGYSVSDRTMTAKTKNPSKSTLETLQYLITYYSQIILSCDSGCFTSALSFSVSGDTLTINFRLLSRLDG